jgi:hypothetical protein
MSLLAYSWNKGFYEQMPIVMGVISLTINLFLVVLMFKTTRRTLERPRPSDIQFTAEGSLIEHFGNG